MENNGSRRKNPGIEWKLSGYAGNKKFFNIFSTLPAL
jgi:hypothetical protein